jgi:hypothetical protein
LAFSGNLQQISLVDLLQLLSLSQKTGTLLILTYRGRFTLAFRDGRIVDATAARHTVSPSGDTSVVPHVQEIRAITPELGNDKAQRVKLKQMASTIVRLSKGHFNFQQSEPETSSAIALEVPSLLLDSFREIDESTRAGIALAGNDGEPAGNINAAGDDTNASPDPAKHSQHDDEPTAPFTWIHDALQRLPSKPSEPQLISLLARFAATIFRRSAIFLAREGQLQGVAAHYGGITREDERELNLAFSLVRIPNGRGGLLEESRDECEIKLAQVDPQWWASSIPKEFGNCPSTDLLVLPVCDHRHGTSVIIMGDGFINEDFTLDWQALQILVQFVRLHMERICPQKRQAFWSLMPFPRRVTA